MSLELRALEAASDALANIDETKSLAQPEPRATRPDSRNTQVTPLERGGTLVNGKTKRTQGSRTVRVHVPDRELDA